MKVVRHRGMTANVHIALDSNSHENLKTIQYLGPLFKKKLLRIKENVDLK